MGSKLPVLHVALLLLAVTSVLTEAASCGYREFRCNSGQCVPGFEKCNGREVCGDGSDEDDSMCNKAPVKSVSVGYAGTVTVQHQQEHEGVEVRLCDGRSCRSLVMRGAAADGALHYEANVGCNHRGGYCTGQHRKAEPAGWRPFPAGQLEFEVERRRSALVVWLKGHPDKAASVPVGDADDKLYVRPIYFNVDMPVHFQDRSTCGYREFRCNSGQCVVGFENCNGRAVCRDGSDEDNALCSGAPVKSFPAGRAATVTVQHQQEHEGVEVRLCDGRSCRSLVMRGAAADGALHYEANVGCNHRGGYCTGQHRKAEPAGWRPFPAGQLEFEVERRRSALVVWLKGHPDKAASVPAGDADDKLYVRPIYFNVDMPVHFQDRTMCGDAPLAPTALVANGEDVGPGQFPWQAAIYLKQSDSEYTFICGGTLISPKLVLTAAHCVFKNNELLSPDKFAVALGKIYSDWSHDEPALVLKTKVVAVHPHPYYVGIGRHYADDAALLELGEAASGMPVCVDDQPTLRAGDKLRVAGWGGGLPRLQTAVFDFKNFSACLDAARNKHEIAFVTYDKFCSDRGPVLANARAPAGLAKGDSGSGAVVLRGGKWYLVGVVSVSLDDSKVYGFTDLRVHQEWRQRIADPGEAARVANRNCAGRC